MSGCAFAAASRLVWAMANRSRSFSGRLLSENFFQRCPLLLGDGLALSGDDAARAAWLYAEVLNSTSVGVDR